MAKVTRVFPYVNGRQIFTMPGGYISKVIYHCWGGGGGGGGDSNDQLGGNGSSGVYTTGEIYLNKGDQVEVVVGGGGQEGRSLESNKKLFSMTLRGSDSISTGAWGYVNDPTQSVYPQYNDWPSPRTSSAWGSFMNQWAVSDIPQVNSGGEEEFTQPIYFPEEGSYEVKMAADNKLTVWFRDQFLAQVDDNFNSSVVSKWISVPGAGTYDLRYKLVNSPSTSKDNNNPAGAAIVIQKTQPSYMGNNGPNPVKGVIWSTRFGRSVDITNQVPLYHAPLVPFYRTQRDNYDWSGFPDGRSMAFISWNSTWGDDDIAKLNLSFDKVIVLNYPVTIRGWGQVNGYISTGYYTFKRGQTWKLAQYSWSGNQKGTWETGAVYPNGVGKATNLNIAGAIDHGSGTPSCWNEKQFANGAKTYTEASPFCSWELPVPSADEIFIVGFDDGQYFTSSNQRGSSNLTWQVNSKYSQTYAGGQGGYSVLNVNNIGLNYYGGYGGQIGDGKTSGGGGGGGGASLILQRNSRGTSLLTVAGGGAGGGGAGPKQFGDNGRNEYQTYTPYPNSAAAGQVGANSADSGGGGGGGGGGQNGGKSGAAALEGVGSRGDGGWQGGSQVTASGLELPKADFVMIGRGGNGGGGGGGGGAGDLLAGQTKLLRTQYIQVGGRGEDKFEGGVSAIWYSETDYIAAGPGGEGGNPESQFSKTGNGQAGGCKNADTNTNLWGGSGGGAGTRTNKSTASGGPAKTWAKKPGDVTSYSNTGGNSSGAIAYAPGGGGGAGGVGSNGGTIATSVQTYVASSPAWSGGSSSSSRRSYYLKAPFQVWFPSGYSSTYSFYLNFTQTGDYHFFGSVDDLGSISVDGTQVLNCNDWGQNFSGTYNISTAGYHKVTINAVNTGGGGGFGFQINYPGPGTGSYFWQTLSPGSSPQPGAQTKVYQVTTASVQSAGNGGPGKTVALGKTGKSYTLGGGGGAAAGYYAPGVQYAGRGQNGGGDGNTGAEPAIQWSIPGTYLFPVPRGVTSIRAQGVGGGGSGGGGGAYGNGGGGSGGYLDTTSVAVSPGQTITVVVGRGGTSGNGGDTVIQFPSRTFILGGGKQASAYTGGDGGSPNGSQGNQGQNGDSPNWTSGSGASSPYGAGGDGTTVSNKSQSPGNGGTGAGGGGGWSNSSGTVNGGLGGAGFVRFEWDGVDSTRAVDSTGSGGGGGFDGGGGEGGTGFVAIAYAGAPLFSFTGENYTIQQNGYTIHECYSSGELVYDTPQTEGRLDSGGGISPGGQGVSGYIPGSAVGGKGQGDTNVYPVPFTQGYTGFLNAYSVWNADLRSSTFDRTYYVYVPETASYDFEAAADNGAQVFVDNGIVLNMTPYDRDNGKYWSQNTSKNTKTLTAGQHKIDIRAVNIGQNGAFGMKIVKSGTSNPLLFNSRQPPVIEGSAQGGNGLVVLEFQGGEGTAKVKVNNAWKQVTGQWFRIGGAWKMITDSAVKVGGSWAGLYGASPFAVSVNTNNFGGPSTPTVATPTKQPDPPVVDRPDPGPDPYPPAPSSSWFVWCNEFPQCTPTGKWSTFMIQNAVWRDASEVVGCAAPRGATKSFSSSFFSFGGTFSVKWACDDSCSVNFVDDSSGKTIFNISSGNNQGSPTTKGGYKLPQGTINVVGSVTNASNNYALNPGGLAMEVYDSSGFVVWSTSNLL